MMNDAGDLSFSLLFPDGRNAKRNVSILDESAIVDLRYKEIIERLVVNKKRTGFIEKIATELCLDTHTIKYRQDILQDFIRNPKIIECIEDIMPRILRLQFYVLHPGKNDIPPVQETVWRIRELEHFVYCVTKLSEIFTLPMVKFRSEGLQKLKKIILEISTDDGFLDLQNTLPNLLRQINSAKSITVGININEGMFPIEAALLSVNSYKFEKPGFLDTLIDSTVNKPIGNLYVDPNGFHTEAAMSPLFRDVFKIMQKSIKPLQKTLSNYGRIDCLMLVNLLDEFLFFIGAAGLFSHLETLGYSATRPSVVSVDKACFHTDGLYNLDLALLKNDGDDIIGNIFDCSSSKRVFVLTGPNHGGKTTFLQAVGLAQILAQIGLFVPAKYAEIGICDNVFTHYPKLENPNLQTGRFGEEALRLRRLMSEATSHSLFLMNETFSSTSYGEALHIAGDLLKIINSMGARCIFATHLHQLVENLSISDNEKEPFSSIVAGIKENPDGTFSPTYVILPGKPLGKSYAYEMARKFGIANEQLVELVKT